MYDNINLTPEMQKAVDIISNSNDNIFITGKAGSGKTTLLRYITHNVSKRFIVCAPTGVAAVNCHGVTMHHMFHIPLGFIAPDVDPYAKYDGRLVELFCNIDTIIIDEISMVRVDVLDYVDRSLRMYRSSGLPFGGVQMVFMGDMYQIAPVVKREEEEALNNFYEGSYFFYAQAFEEKGFHVLELSHVFRQKEGEFVDTLNRIRVYEFTEQDRQLLAGTRNKEICDNLDTNYVHLCTHRNLVNEINSTMLGKPTNTYKAEFTGQFSKGSCVCDEELNLRVGARVMALVNDKDKKYYNGSLGTVTELKDSEVTVKLDNGLTVTFAKNKWAEFTYQFKDGAVQQFEKGTCTQIPLALAWACTVHKSQGKQWDRVAIHIGHVFSPGMIYVALSRCTSLDGLVTDTYITKRHVIVDQRLRSFYLAVAKTGGFFSKQTIKYII